MGATALHTRTPFELVMTALDAHMARFIQEGWPFWRLHMAAKRLAVPTVLVRTRGAQDCHHEPPEEMSRNNKHK